MPTYDYECSACGHRFDELQSFSDPPLTKCPNCKKNKLVRLFGGGGAIIFKGGGFYETDYRRAGEANTGDKPEGGDAAKTEAKPEAKAETTPTPAPAPAPAPKSGGTASTGKSDGKGGGKKSS